MDPERLTAWMDDTLATEADRQTVAAHVATCPHCAAAAAQLRAYKDRLIRYRAATTPTTLPAGFWERVEERLPASRRWSSVGSRWSVAAVALALLIAVAALALWPQPRAVLQVDRILATPIPTRLALVTEDADKAAQWLGDRLGVNIPPVSLTLTGARMMGATADRRREEGAFVYRDVRGVPIALRLYLAPRTALPPMPAVLYEGSAYRAVERKAPLTTLVAWQRGGRTYLATAPLPLAELLPHVREMDRRCQRGP